MTSADRDREENAAIALALLTLAREVLEGRAEARIQGYGDASWLEYRHWAMEDGIHVSASKAIRNTSSGRVEA